MTKKMLYNLYWQGQIELLLFLSQIEIIDKFCQVIFSSIELENLAQNNIFFCNWAILIL